MKKIPKKIAYLAPEIPALSATFVYNEILGLEEKGFHILPISVHRPAHPAQEEATKSIREKTIFLYEQGLGQFSLSYIWSLLTSPISCFKTSFLALSDAMKVGLFNRITFGLFYRLLAGARVARLLKINNCEHLHVHFAHIPTDIAMYASSFSGIPFSFMSHANDLFERGWLLPEKVNRAKFAATISVFNKNFLAQHGANEDKIIIIRCGIDSKAFQPRLENPISIPLKLGSLGRMVEKKGFDILIKACKILKDRNILFDLELAGDGPLCYDLEQLTINSGLATEITFRGSLQHDEVPAWMKRLDVFVLPCKKDKHGDMDGIPVVLMEAMLSGIPVVSTKLSGIPELVGNNMTGLLAEPGDPDSLAQCLEKIMTEPELVVKITRNAIVKVRDEFDLAKNTDKVAENLLPLAHNLFMS